MNTSSFPESSSQNSSSPKKQKSLLREYTEAFLVAFLVAFFLRAFVVQAFVIPSGSMIPTLLVGDHLFVSMSSYGIRLPFTKKWVAHFDTPKRGDVVVFIYPGAERHTDSWEEKFGVGFFRPIGIAFDAVWKLLKLDEEDYIKRVIGLPGDRVVFKDRTLYINDEIMTTYPAMPPEDHSSQSLISMTPDASTPQTDRFQLLPYFQMNMARLGLPPDFRYWWDFDYLVENLNSVPHWVQYMKEHRDQQYPGSEFEITVPEGKIFVMGDNRDNSSDSRFWGFVPMENLKGKAMFIWLSTNDYSDSLLPVRWERFGRWVR